MRTTEALAYPDASRNVGARAPALVKTSGIRAILVAVSAAIAGCVQLGTGTDAGTDAGATSVTTGTATSAAMPQGLECFADVQTQTTLCDGISTCPTVTVDPGVFPDCGFRIHAGSVLDLECLCDGTSLCPVGVPTTCAQAAQLLADQNVFQVCEQEAEGFCIDLVTPPTSSSSCDKSCESQCGGDPSCMQLCGC
jgi:hypothetical protein